MDNDEISSIMKRLDIIIALMLRSSADGSENSMGSKIAALAELGLSRSEIGRVLGKPANYISAVLGAKKNKGR